MYIHTYTYIHTHTYTYLTGYGLDVLVSNPSRSQDWLWGPSSLLPHEYRSLGGNSRDIKMAIHFVELGQRMRGALRARAVCLCFICVWRDIM